MKAVVLAGGKSSRMGQDKALLMLGEKVIIQRILDVVSTVFDEVYISGNRVAYQSFSKNIIEDKIIDKGPMGGIYSALEFLKEDVFVCSCDMPFISNDMIRNMLNKKQEDKINTLKYKDRIYPVFGIFPYSVLNVLKDSLLKDKLKMTSFLETQKAHYIEIDKESENHFLNINTPENFEKAQTIFKQL